MKYDPRLREAAEEFKALCRKYDCMGFVLFVSPSHSEYVSHVDAPWSVAKIEDGKLRFRSKLEDFNGDKKAQHFATESTVHALTSIVEWTRQQNHGFTLILQELKKKMRIMWHVWDKPDSVPGDGL